MLLFTFIHGYIDYYDGLTEIWVRVVEAENEEKAWEQYGWKEDEPDDDEMPPSRFRKEFRRIIPHIPGEHMVYYHTR